MIVIRSGRRILGIVDELVSPSGCFSWRAKAGSKDSGVTAQGKEAAINLVLASAFADSDGRPANPAGVRRQYEITITS